MKISLLALLLLFTTFVNAQEAHWNTNFDSTKVESKNSGKKVLLKFSGSDWCVSCIKLDRKVLQSAEFKTYASENLILHEADFPAKKKNKLSKAQQSQNDELAEKYNQKGVFPLLVVLDQEGKIIGTVPFVKDSKTCIEEINKLLK